MREGWSAWLAEMSGTLISDLAKKLGWKKVNMEYFSGKTKKKTMHIVWLDPILDVGSYIYDVAKSFILALLIFENGTTGWGREEGTGGS